MSNAAYNLKQSLRSLQGLLAFARSQWVSIRRSVPIVSGIPRATVIPLVPLPLADPAADETLSGDDTTETVSPTTDLWRELSPAGAADVQQQVLAQPLSPTLQQWIADYRGFGPRDLYLWRWCALGARLTTLPCV